MEAAILALSTKKQARTDVAGSKSIQHLQNLAITVKIESGGALDIPIGLNLNSGNIDGDKSLQ